MKIDKDSFEWQQHNAKCTAFAERVQYEADRKIIAFIAKEHKAFVEQSQGEQG